MYYTCPKCRRKYTIYEDEEPRCTFCETYLEEDKTPDIELGQELHEDDLE